MSGYLSLELRCRVAATDGASEESLGSGPDQTTRQSSLELLRVELEDVDNDNDDEDDVDDVDGLGSHGTHRLGGRGRPLRYRKSTILRGSRGNKATTTGTISSSEELSASGFGAAGATTAPSSDELSVSNGGGPEESEGTSPSSSAGGVGGRSGANTAE